MEPSTPTLRSAADAPEITLAVTALSRGQASVGAGVVIGSDVFDLAALLGLGCGGGPAAGLALTAVVLVACVAGPRRPRDPGAPGAASQPAHQGLWPAWLPAKDPDRPSWWRATLPG